MTRVSPGLRVARLCLELGSFGASAGGLDDDVAAVCGGEGVELELVVLGACADSGVADADGVAVGRRRRGAVHRVIVPEGVPELNGAGLVAGRLAGRVLATIEAW